MYYLTILKFCRRGITICSIYVDDRVLCNVIFEGSPLWRAFLCFKEEPLEDSRTYVSSHSIVPDSCIFSDSKYFSSILRNLWRFRNTHLIERFRRAAVNHRQSIDTDLHNLIYIDIQKGSYHMRIIGKLMLTLHTEISLLPTCKAFLDHLCLLVTIRTLRWSTIIQAII